MAQVHFPWPMDCMDFDVPLITDLPLTLEAGAEADSLKVPSALVQIGFFLLSLLDDAAILGLSRLGIHIPGLNFLGAIVVLAIVAHWMWQLGHHLIDRGERRFSLSSIVDPNGIN
jgi:hypothetical protein